MRALDCQNGISERLLVREHHHRFMILGALTALLLLSTVPIMGHHVIDISRPIHELQHIGVLCMEALGQLLAPVHWGFHLAVGVGFVYALSDRVRAARGLHRTLAALDGATPKEHDEVAQAARKAHVDPRFVVVVRGLPNPAFTAGIVAPRIYLSAEVVQQLSPAELVSVLAHEGAHVKRRDPLRISVYRFIGCTLFWIPALRSLAHDMVDEAEIRADDVAGLQNPLVLAAAILRLATWRASLPQSAVGLTRPDLLERRVRRLAGEETPLPTHVTRLSVAGAFLSVGLVLASGLAADRIDTNKPEHCSHSDTSSWAHLFCAATSSVTVNARCPHSN